MENELSTAELLARVRQYALNEEGGFGWNRSKHERKSWKALVAWMVKAEERLAALEARDKCDCEQQCHSDCTGDVAHRYCENCFQAWSAEAYEIGKEKSK